MSQKLFNRQIPLDFNIQSTSMEEGRHSHRIRDRGVRSDHHAKHVYARTPHSQQSTIDALHYTSD